MTHEDNEVFSSLPRAGKRLAPWMPPEWGDDRHRYADATCVQALAGTAQVPYESGNYATVHQRYACIKPLRNAFYQFVRAVYPTRGLGQGLLRAKTKAWEKS